ncbi:MAG: tetratricopeptide repeat protein, partial [Acidobacteriota bacterium]|nr:tetratricopeptide repeat protein [Acidobacteriota bacterium]
RRRHPEETRDARPATWALVVGITLVIALGARASVRVADWRDDLRLFESAVRLTPGESIAHVNYGVALADRGNPAAAEDQFREVLSLDPGNVKAHYNLGNIYRERGDLVAAEAAYRAALRVQPTHAQSHLNLGLVLVATGRTAMALDAFTRADEVLPDHVDAKINRANALRLLDRAGEAAPFFRDALELEPRSWAARLGLAQAELETGRYDQGLERLRGLVTDHPDLVEAHLSMAIELDRRGAYELAEAAYLEVLRLDPGNRKVMLRLGLAVQDEDGG